jgi:hypothetical protein
MFEYTSPRGVEATDDQIIEAASNYKKFGTFPFYKEIPYPAKRIAGAYILGAALAMTIDEVNEQAEHSEAFRVLVDTMITGYEKRHPQNSDQAVLAIVLRELADRLRTPDPDEDQARYDVEFASIIAGLDVTGAKSETE